MDTRVGGLARGSRWFGLALLLLLTLASMGCASRPGDGGPVLAFAAASLSDTLPEIGQSYARETGVRVDFSFGSSGALADQALRGAPADLFISPGSKLVLAIGASDPIISLNAPEGISAQNLLAGRIESVHVVERRALVFVDVGVPLVVQVGANAVRKLELREGLQVHLILKTTTAMLPDTASGPS